MNIAFEISYDDISTVLSQRFDENTTDELCEEILNNYIDTDIIEKEALHGDDLDQQTNYAHDCIESQIKNHWDDINLLLNEI